MTKAEIKNKCTCDEHDCEIKDDYTQNGYMCEECFMDCVEMENEWAIFLDLKKQFKLDHLTDEQILKLEEIFKDFE